MNLFEKLKQVEYDSTRDSEWLYHVFPHGSDIFIDIATQGIKCRKMLSIPTSFFNSFCHNGKYYISLSKATFVEEGFSSFVKYLTSFAFIVDGVKATKCRLSKEYTLLESTRWPIRYSGFMDEYQAYKIITPDKIVGLRTSLINWYQSGEKAKLVKLKDMLTLMRKFNLDFPVYDYSRMFNENVHIINQDEYLDVCDDLIESMNKKKI